MSPRDPLTEHPPSMNRRAFLRVSSILLFSLITACDLFQPVTETPPSRMPTQPPVATTAAPSATAVLPTATQPPTVTPTQGPTATLEMEAISPGNADRLALDSQFSAGAALDFAWLPDNQGVILVNSDEVLSTSQQSYAPSSVLKAGSLTHFRLAPDGKHYSVVQDNTRVMLGELTGGITQTLAALPGVVTSLAFSPDSTRLAVASSDANQVVVWDTRGGVILANFTLPYWLSDLAITQENSLLAGSDLSQFSLLFLDTLSGEIQRSLQWTESASPALYGAVLSPDWSQVAWYSRGTVQLMDATSGALGSSLEHEDFITTVAWSPDSKLIASGAAATVGKDFVPVVIVWDPVTAEQLAVLPLKTPVSQLKFNPEGTQIGVLTADGGFQAWKIKP